MTLGEKRVNARMASCPSFVSLFCWEARAAQRTAVKYRLSSRFVQCSTRVCLVPDSYPAALARCIKALRLEARKDQNSHSSLSHRIQRNHEVALFCCCPRCRPDRFGTPKVIVTKPVLILVSQAAPSELVKRASVGEVANIGYATLNGG